MQQRNPGFTLSELLIGLAVVGLIVAFNIPKVLQAGYDASNQAVLKETIATLQAINYEGGLTDDLKRSNAAAYFAERLNAVRYCEATKSYLQGCWQASMNHSSPYGEYLPGVGFVLPNGAHIMGFRDPTPSHTSTQRTVAVVDANGPSGPNQPGQDQIHLDVLFNITPTATLKPYVVQGRNHIQLNSVAHYRSLFSNQYS
jgi:prepilin-type N-terminal cleavage/methylation domain-containing protein